LLQPVVHDLLAAVAGQVQSVEARGSPRQPAFHDSLWHVTISFETSIQAVTFLKQGKYVELSGEVTLQSCLCVASGTRYHFLIRHQNQPHGDMLLCPSAQAVMPHDRANSSH